MNIFKTISDLATTILSNSDGDDSAGARTESSTAPVARDKEEASQDDAIAVAACRRSAEAGDAAAQNQLGQMYRVGRGVTSDMAQAAEWFRKAAEHGMLICAEF